MEHHFSKEIATEFGIDLAVFLQNIAFWIEKNIVNNKNLRDGKYWTYNTQKAWINLFPYWSRQNIRTIISKAIKEDLIVLGNFNSDKSDHTTWYALTEKGLNLFPTVKKLITHQKDCDDIKEEKLSTAPTPNSDGWNQPINDHAGFRVVNTNQPLVDSNHSRLVDSNHSSIADNKPYNKHRYPKAFHEYQKQDQKPNPFPSATFTDVTRQSTSARAAPVETPEEASRKAWAVLGEYQRHVEKLKMAG